MDSKILISIFAAGTAACFGCASFSVPDQKKPEGKTAGLEKQDQAVSLTAPAQQPSASEPDPVMAETETDRQPDSVKTEPVQLRLQVPESIQETGWWCAPAALQMVSGYYGLHFSQQELADLMHTSPVTGTEYEDLAETATDLIFTQTGRSGQYTAVLFTSADGHLRSEFEERALQDLRTGSPVFAAINTAVMYQDADTQVHQTVIYGADVNEEGKAERWYYLDPGSQRTSEYGQKYWCRADELWNAMLNSPEPGYVY